MAGDGPGTVLHLLELLDGGGGCRCQVVEAASGAISDFPLCYGAKNQCTERNRKRTRLTLSHEAAIARIRPNWPLAFYD